MKTNAPASRRPTRETLESLAQDFTASIGAEPARPRRDWPVLALAGAVLVAVASTAWVLSSQADTARPRPGIRASAEEVETLRQRRDAARERARKDLAASSGDLERMAAADAQARAGNGAAVGGSAR